MRIISRSSSLISMSPIIALVIAGVLMGVFAITGGSASFKQVLATSVHAGVVSTVAGVINTIINYVRATTVNITSLAGLGQAFAEKGFVAGFLGALDLAVLWWLFVLALGMDIQPTALHQRVPVFLGSRNEIDIVTRYHLEADDTRG